MNELAGLFRKDLRPRGWGDSGEDLEKEEEKDRAFSKRLGHIQTRRDVNRSRDIVERYKKGEEGIPEHDIRMCERVLQRHVEARRSFGTEGSFGRGRLNPCETEECNLEHDHEGDHAFGVFGVFD